MKHLIYLELDAILDTRIATIDRIDPDVSKKLVKKGSGYWQRETDDFRALVPTWDHVAYTELYAKRDMETLQRATMTTVMVILNSLKETLDIQMADQVEVEGYGYEVNCYPYRLSDVEKDHLVLALRHYLGFIATIELIYVPYQQLTLLMIRSRYSEMYLYNLTEWLSAIGENVKGDGRAPDTSMMVPMLYQDSTHIPTLDDYITTNERKLSPAETMKVVFAEYIGLDFITAECFSLLEPLE